MKVMIFLTLLSIIAIAYATSSPDLMVSESRKNVRQSSSPSPLNSLASSQDGPNKQQSQQQVQPQQQSYSLQQDYSNSGQPHSTVYNHIQSGTAPSPTPQNGYIISVNQNGQHSVGATPVLMQYLPQNQQSGGIQYLQLIPTRPLIVPISPYISQLPQYGGPSTGQPQYGGPSTGQPQYGSPSSGPPQAAQYTSTSQPYGSAPPSYGSAPPSYGSTQPTSSHNYPSYQNPIGGYSSPVVSYFRPHSGIQLVNGPVDMSLNTNEYIPIQSESAFKMRRS